VGIGHKHFAILPGPLNGHKLSEERLSGAREGLNNFGLTLSSKQILATPYDPDSVRAAVRAIMTAGLKVSALIGGNDMIAAAAIAECRRLGIDCPGQVSITGFGDWGLARLMSPALTTIHSDAVRIGLLTADNLLSQIQGKAVEHWQSEYEPELVIRESTAPIQTATS
jgi:LacI family transcriptional regulator